MLVVLPAGVAMTCLFVVPLLEIVNVNRLIYVVLDDLSMVLECSLLCPSMLSPDVSSVHTPGVSWGMLRLLGRMARPAP